ncbi:thioredoxin TrxC [Acinetobacter sp. B5B]|uniref:thioredoxin TrxC n=1 Tax=Acinetobacter baretiae TaxID=2605383 RepID=UPI0018C26D40|nr:thioredoxin TrxC [Acinetobacter baretiae]MBF7683808.1 thioredoxin TrxC [Acinetobacter baretiae]MBF7686118.1 thioredoxin TrxC [Acinetobacter baretiae]
MIVVCPTCTAKNRLESAQLNDDPLCGQCRTILLQKKPIELNEKNFSTFIQYSDLPIVIDLWADWCGPCKAMAPHFAHVASQYQQVVFAKINTETNPRLSQAFHVRSIPTLVLMNKTTELARVSGALKATELKQWVDQNITKVSFT